MESFKPSLAQHPFFQGLDGGHLRKLARITSSKSFPAHQMIFYEGERANEFYLLSEGKVAIEMPLFGFEDIQIQTLGKGDALGWSWLVPPYQWHFSARAVEPTQAIAMDGEALRALCDEDHHLGYEVVKRFAQVMVQRLEATRTRFLSFPDPKQHDFPLVPRGVYLPEE
jgi:CRP-like cAMP-binding protein